VTTAAFSEFEFLFDEKIENMRLKQRNAADAALMSEFQEAQVILILSFYFILFYLFFFFIFFFIFIFLFFFFLIFNFILFFYFFFYYIFFFLIKYFITTFSHKFSSGRPFSEMHTPFSR
jgi:hypothetical protein